MCPDTREKITELLNCQTPNPLVGNKWPFQSDVNDTENDSPCSPLINACADGNLEQVKQLIRMGHNVNEINVDGDTPLICAISSEHLDIGKLLLENGGEVDRCPLNTCITPLMEASSAGLTDFVALLLKYGAQVENVSSSGSTALHCAASNGHLDCVKLLVDEIQTIESTSHHAGATLIACSYATRFIKRENHDPLPVTMKEMLALQNEGGHNALMEATTNGWADIVKYLVEMGADVNSQSLEFKESPLTMAAYKGHTAIARFLIDHGADIEHHTDEMHTPLMEATMDGHLDTAKMLIQAGATVQMLPDSFESPLTIAASYGHIDLVALYIAHGANMEGVNDEGYTPLMEACREGFDQIAAYLLALGANVNVITEENQETALSLAASTGFEKLVNLLLDYGANVDAGCITPLMEAAQEGHVGIVSALLRRGANANILSLPHHSGTTTATNSSMTTTAVASASSTAAATTTTNVPSSHHSSSVPTTTSSSGTTAPPIPVASNSNTLSGGETALQLAVDNGHLDVARELIVNGGASVSHFPEQIQTVLMKAAKLGKLDMVRLLVEIGHAQVDEVCSEGGETALSIACGEGHLEVVNYLLAKGADRKIHLKDNNSCYLEAVRSGDVNVVQLIQGQIPTNYDILNQPIASSSAEEATPCECSTANPTSSNNPVCCHQQADGNISLTEAEESDLNPILDDPSSAMDPNNTSSTCFCHLHYRHNSFANHGLLSSTVDDLDSLTALTSLTEAADLSVAPVPLVVARNALEDVDDVLPNVDTLMDKGNPEPEMKNEGDPLESVEENVCISCGHESNSSLVANGGGVAVASPLLALENIIHEIMLFKKAGRTHSADTEENEALAAAALMIWEQTNPILPPQDCVCDDEEDDDDDANEETTHAFANASTAAGAYRFGNSSTVSMSGDSRSSSSTGSLPTESDAPNVVSTSDAATATTSTSAHTVAMEGVTPPPPPPPLPPMLSVEEPLSLSKYANIQSQLSKRLSSCFPSSQAALYTEEFARSLHIMNQFKSTTISISDDDCSFLPHPEVSRAPLRPPPQQSAVGHGSHSITATTSSSSKKKSKLKMSPKYNSTASQTMDEDRQLPFFDINTSLESTCENALHLTCERGHVDMARYLLENGANLEQRDKKDSTPLHTAITFNRIDIVRLLISFGTDLEAHIGRNKDSPLQMAANAGRFEIVQELLRHGANKEYRNVSDYTALCLAASNGHLAVVKCLLSHGADINSRFQSKLGISPLMLAAMNGHIETVHYLLEKGADVNAQIETNRNTALTLAAFQGRADIVKVLADHGANLHHRTKTGLNSLMEAATYGYTEVGHILLAYGAEVNPIISGQCKDPPICLAAEKGHAEFLRLLLEHGAHIEAKNKRGLTALYLAASGGHSQCVSILLERNAMADVTDNRQTSALIVAFRSGFVSVVQALLNRVMNLPSTAEMQRHWQAIHDQSTPETKENIKICHELIEQKRAEKLRFADMHRDNLLKELDLEDQDKRRKDELAAKKREKKRAKKKQKKMEKEKKVDEEEEEGSVNHNVIDGRKNALQSESVTLNLVNGDQMSTSNPGVGVSSFNEEVEKENEKVNKMQASIFENCEKNTPSSSFSFASGLSVVGKENGKHEDVPPAQPVSITLNKKQRRQRRQPTSSTQSREEKTTTSSAVTTLTATATMTASSPEEFSLHNADKLLPTSQAPVKALTTPQPTVSTAPVTTTFHKSPSTPVVVVTSTPTTTPVTVVVSKKAKPPRPQGLGELPSSTSSASQQQQPVNARSTVGGRTFNSNVSVSISAGVGVKSSEPVIIMQVPECHIGRVIGQGGATVNALRSKTSSSIEISAAGDKDNADTRRITLRGPQICVNMARELIQALVDGRIHAKQVLDTSSLSTATTASQQSRVPPGSSGSSSFNVSGPNQPPPPLPVAKTVMPECTVNSHSGSGPLLPSSAKWASQSKGISNKVKTPPPQSPPQPPSTAGAVAHTAAMTQSISVFRSLSPTPAQQSSATAAVTAFISTTSPATTLPAPTVVIVDPPVASSAANHNVIVSHGVVRKAAVVSPMVSSSTGIEEAVSPSSTQLTSRPFCKAPGSDRPFHGMRQRKTEDSTSTTVTTSMGSALSLESLHTGALGIGIQSGGGAGGGGSGGGTFNVFSSISSTTSVQPPLATVSPYVANVEPSNMMMIMTSASDPCEVPVSMNSVFGLFPLPDDLLGSNSPSTSPLTSVPPPMTSNTGPSVFSMTPHFLSRDDFSSWSTAGLFEIHDDLHNDVNWANSSTNNNAYQQQHHHHLQPLSHSNHPAAPVPASSQPPPTAIPHHLPWASGLALNDSFAAMNSRPPLGNFMTNNNMDMFSAAGMPYGAGQQHHHHLQQPTHPQPTLFVDRSNVFMNKPNPPPMWASHDSYLPPPAAHFYQPSIPGHMESLTSPPLSYHLFHAPPPPQHAYAPVQQQHYAPPQPPMLQPHAPHPMFLPPSTTNSATPSSLL